MQGAGRQVQHQQYPSCLGDNPVLQPANVRELNNLPYECCAEPQMMVSEYSEASPLP